MVVPSSIARRSLLAAAVIAAMLLSVQGGVPMPTPSITPTPPCDVPLELLAHWDMEEGNGTVFIDVTGNGHNATNQGEVSYFSGGFGSFATTYIRDPLSRATVPNVPPLSNVKQMSAFMWARPHSLIHTFNVFFTTWGSAVGAYHFAFFQDVLTFHYNDNTVAKSIDNPSESALNTWTHVGFILDPCIGQSELYQDGVLVATGVYNNLQLHPTPLDITIGGKADGNFGFEGDLDDVRFYSGRLGGAEITTLSSAL